MKRLTDADRRLSPAAAALVNEYHDLARLFANSKVKQRVLSLNNYDDAVQHLTIHGLFRAAQTFDETKPACFRTHAYTWLMFAWKNFIRTLVKNNRQTQICEYEDVEYVEIRQSSIDWGLLSVLMNTVRINETEKEVLRMRYFNGGLTAFTVSRKLGIPISKVKCIERKAIRLMRTVVNRSCIRLDDVLEGSSLQR
jgi:RNA polymerase sigma factor (sigma-70 family)